MDIGSDSLRSPKLSFFTKLFLHSNLFSVKIDQLAGRTFFLRWHFPQLKGSYYLRFLKVKRKIKTLQPVRELPYLPLMSRQKSPSTTDLATTDSLTGIATSSACSCLISFSFFGVLNPNVNNVRAQKQKAYFMCGYFTSILSFAINSSLAPE